MDKDTEKQVPTKLVLTKLVSISQTTIPQLHFSEVGSPSQVDTSCVPYPPQIL